MTIIKFEDILSCAPDEQIKALKMSGDVLHKNGVRDSLLDLPFDEWYSVVCAEFAARFSDNNRLTRFPSFGVLTRGQT
jgi:hypothetical protein